MCGVGKTRWRGVRVDGVRRCRLRSLGCGYSVRGVTICAFDAVPFIRPRCEGNMP
ncbi:hypothetical protein D8O03_05365 [Burkholderia mallei]|nr:hypothetical protein D8O03_05365 [Burkholderia mallei]